MENNKINIAEILKDCPIGMELYSPIFGDVYLNKIRPHLAIVVTIDKEQGKFKEEFLYDGRYWINGECMLFPSKDQRDWSKFQRPPFKDGDILISVQGNPFILKEIHNDKICKSYCGIRQNGEFVTESNHWTSNYNLRFATEEEKQKLFKVIKEHGYYWNAETKILEKLVEPKFNVGDRIRRKNGIDKYGGIEEGIIKYIKDNTYGITIPYLVDIVAHVNIADQDNWELVTLQFKTGDRIRRRIKRRNDIDEEGVIKCVSFNFYDILTTDEKIIPIRIGEQDEWELVPDIEPKFNVGDRIKHKLTGEIYTVMFVLPHGGGTYDVAVTNEIGKSISIKEQDDYELVSNKFDITTLVPFESRVLVRHTKDEIWKPAIFGCYNGYRYYVLGDVHWAYCIPYEGNEHLCGNIDDCDEYYKTWE